MKTQEVLLCWLVLTVVTVAWCNGQINETLRVCESETLIIECDDGKVIHIHDALYGRMSNEFCKKNQDNINCAAQSSLSIVTGLCGNHTSCSVQAENDVFGDPCYGTVKYLEVSYSCVRICGLNDRCSNVTEICLNDGEGDVLCNCKEDYERVNGICKEIPVPCPEDVVYKSGVTLTFPQGKTGEFVDSVERCPSGSSKQEKALATRYCDEIWAHPEMTQCNDENTLENQLEEISNMDVTEDNVEEVGEMLVLASSQTDLITESGLENIITSLDLIVQVGSPEKEVTDSVVGVVNNVMSLNETMLIESSDINEVVPLLEIQVGFVHGMGVNYTELVPNLGVSALLLEKTSLEVPFVFEDPFMDSDDDVDDSRRSSITLPPSVLDMVHAVNPNLSSIPVSFITYRDAALFQSDSEISSTNQEASSVIDEYVNSHVISATIEIDDVIVNNLPQNSSVVTKFSKPQITEEGNNTKTNVRTEFVCVFWEYNPIESKGAWSDQGCRMVSNDTEIVCACNHLTSFAVLVRLSSDSINHLILSVITTIGCSISIICLSFSLIAMVVIGSVRTKQQTHVHFNLCLALLGLYMSFLLGVDRTDIPEVCRAMTSLIYFFCLSSVAWMSVEAFYIYMLIWKYKRSSVRHLITIAVLLAWGLPAIAAIVISFLDHGLDYEQSPEYCFLHPGPVLYFGFLLEVFLLSFYNFAVFILATYRVSCRKITHTDKAEKRKEILIRVKSTFLFWVLLGMAWTFGFLATFQNPLSLVFEVLFCICLSLQGFCMFYMLFVQNPEMRKTFQSQIQRSATSSSDPVAGTKSAYVKNDHYSPDPSLNLQNNPVYVSTDNYE